MKHVPRYTFALTLLAFMAAGALYLWYVTRVPEEAPIGALDIYEMRFDKPDILERLEVKNFSGESQYEIIEDPDRGRVLKASSQGTSSVLYDKSLKISMEEKPILNWEWKAIQFPEKEKKKNEVLGARGDNDYVGRVYAMFRGSTILTSDVIEYIWDDHFEAGTWRNSPYSDRVKLLVVQKSEAGQEDGWVQERRDLYLDYKNLFGEAPDKPLGAVGIMSDSDDTETSSALLFSNLSIRIPGIIKAQQELEE